MKPDQAKINLAWAKLNFRMSSQARIDVYRMLYFMLRNGISTYDTIKELHRRAVKKGKDHPATIMYSAWLSQMDSGRDLSEAISDWVPSEERVLLSSGGKAGKLESILLRVIESVKFGTQIRRALTGATTYPAVLFVAAMGIIAMFGIKIIPVFAEISDPKTWTGLAGSMHTMSGIVRNWWWVLLAFVVVTFVAYRYSLPNMTGKLRVWLDRFPPYSYYRLRQGSGFLVSLSVLVETGTNIERALLMLRKDGDKWLRERVDPLIASSRSGLNLGDAMERAGHGFPDRAIIDSIAIFSQRAELDKALEITAKEWMENGIERVNAQAAVLKTVAFFSVVLIVLWLVLGLFAIQQQISQTIQQGGF